MRPGTGLLGLGRLELGRNSKPLLEKTALTSPECDA